MTLLWPSMTDYSGAIQNAAQSFQLPALAGAEFETLAMMGLPAFASGQNAVVFSAKIGSSKTAVRCFTSPSHDGRRRYRALEQHLRDNPVGSMAGASWVDDAIEVNGALWPVVTMDWIEGSQLHDWVEDNVYNPAALSLLASSWMATCTSLRTAEVTHGDLQHGNVLVDASGNVRLIDFDGVWLREIDDSPPSEVGHPNYQHPDRSKTGAWGWSIDWFSALGVLVSLRALAADPSLWELHNGENLIFRESDFWGDAEIWNMLERSPDNDVVDLARLLAQGCGHPCDAPFDLPTIVRQGLTEVKGPPDLGPRANNATGDAGTATTPGAPGPERADASKSGTEDPPTDWWASSNVDDTQVKRPRADPPRRPASPPPESAPGDVNFVWVTGSSRTADSAPPIDSPENGTPGVRPPERERPAEQSVRSNWNDAGSPPPPPMGHATPPRPRPAGATTAQQRSSASTHQPRAATSASPSSSGLGIAGYIAIILIFLVVGILIGALAGGS